MRRTSFFRFSGLFFCGIFLYGCTGLPASNKIDPAGNLTREDYLALRHRGDAEMEATAKAPPIPDMPTEKPPEPPAPPEKRVSITVTDDTPLRDILIELGREGNVNLEVDPRIQGNIIFTAHDQPFSAVLQRICILAGLRHKQEGAFIRVELDEPYQQTYPVDYLSLARKSTSEVTIATNVFDVDVSNTNGNSGGNTGSRNQGDNNSVAKIAGTSDADFWAELDKSLTQVLATKGRDQSLIKNGANTNSHPSNFSIDRQAGLVTVFGNELQQEAVQKYLRRLQNKASAQVLIEARIVEVELTDEFQSGINWRTLFNGSLNTAARFGTVGSGAPFSTATTAADGLFTASLKEGDFAGILSLVRTFGATRILSSPRLTVLNNQTAVLKVARNEVYFLTNAQFPTAVNTSGVTVSGTPVFSSTPRTVPVGLVMTVQPSIDKEREKITMTLRPTISRVVSYVQDPSISLNAAQAGVTTTVESKIPVLAVREMDSVVQLHSGEVAVMGGLMQDSSENTDQGVPPLDTLPFIGNIAKSRDNSGATSELVILLRATILDNARPDSADIDLYQRYNNDPRPLPIKETYNEKK